MNKIHSLEYGVWSRGCGGGLHDKFLFNCFCVYQLVRDGAKVLQFVVAPFAFLDY